MTTKVTVIGAFGSAGTAVTGRLLEAHDEGEIDLDLTLIDDGDPGGGLCILKGCMPSKEVLSAAAHRYQARADDRIDGVPEVDLEEVYETKQEHITSFAHHRRESVYGDAERENVEFIRGTANFVDDHTVEVDGREIESDYVVIATGSTLNVPDLPGLDDVDYTTSAEVLDRTEFPDTGVVMGFGTVSLEMVPYLSEAGGMDLSVIEHDDTPIDGVDERFGETVVDMYEEDWGVDVVDNAYEQRVEESDDGVRLVVEKGGEEFGIEADELFLFTGRRPNLDGMALENTSLSPGEGWVEDTMQAADSRDVYVVGDANGRTPILHIAKEQGFLAAKNIVADSKGRDLEEFSHFDHKIIFSGASVYPFARIGVTEREAQEEGIDHVAVSRKASDDGVFKTKDAAKGLAKLVVGDDGTVLGWQALHYQADTMAKTMQVVVKEGMDVRDVPDRAYHPTTTEVIDGLVNDAKDRLGLD
ncbi:MAG: NAD(P)/FAD-dependent oxidoreductase [Halobacteria archaeon]